MVIESTGVADAVAGVAPRLAPGVELIGEYQGSGFTEPKYILRRSDAQIIQLPRLLYLLAANLDGQRDLAQVASVLSAQTGRVLQAEHLTYLIDKKLRPVGIVADESPAADTNVPAKHQVRSDPLLALKFRIGVVPERSVWHIARLFGPMFWPPAIVTLLAAFVALDTLILARGGGAQIVPSALTMVYQPTSLLLVLAMALASAVFHECGHVSACRYGGARPGKMGIGLYLLWPAFYSTVTDSYRLSRAGRLRTDLGGVYFNAVFIGGMDIAYLNTSSPWLLMAIIVLHIETATQFLPMIRLDGYYILSDLVGVPDLFSWIGPVLASAIPGRPTHRQVRQLKPWVRRTITLWVVVVVPSIAYWVIGFLIVVPRVLPVVGHRLLDLTAAVGADAAAGNFADATLDAVDLLLLVLPWIGSLLLLTMIVRWPLKEIWVRWSPAWFRLRRS
jgi:putative peptide zinc metalloprotease protein